VGQEPLTSPQLPDPAERIFVDPIFSPGRGGSPVETLETATGRRTREDGSGEIETDRDSFTPATSTAGRGRLIIESAYSFLEHSGNQETHSFPELLLRYGVTERVELRLGWNYEIGKAGNDVSGSDAGGEDVFGGARLERLSRFSYGVKVQVTEQDRYLPRSVVIVQAATPTTGVETATQLAVTYAAGWEFANSWRLDTSMRWIGASDAGDRFNEWAPSAVLRVPLGERWAAHAEYFGIVTSGKERNTTRHYVSPGLHCLLTPDLEVGVRLGWGLNDQSDRFFVNAGFGWQY
jgi:hypothetical protein